METNSAELDMTQFKPQKSVNCFESPEISTSSDAQELVKFSAPNPKMRTYSSQKADVFDVAAYILNKLGQMTTMKLHKLLYYAQAWSLVWDEKPLFSEEIQAWANGPVIKDLFNFHKGQFAIDSVAIGNPKILSEQQKETIDSVLDYYGGKSSQWLIQLTHLEDPWVLARKGLSQTERSNRVISLDSMANYYSSL